MTTVTGQKLASLLLSLGGIIGSAAMLAVSVQHPAHAKVLWFCAFVWLLSCGASKLLVDLTGSTGADDPGGRFLDR